VVDLDAARRAFDAASRAAEDALLDVISAQSGRDGATVREALAGYVERQLACLVAHDELAAATGRHTVAQPVREDLAKDRRLLEENLTAARAELDRLDAVAASPPASA
jgi:hypothetical protein